MSQNERMLELAGLSVLLSSAKFALSWHQQVPDRPIVPTVRHGLERAIEFLRQALSGLRNRETWDKEGKFALSREYIRQDQAYRAVHPALSQREDRANDEKALSEYIAALEAVRDGEEVEASRAERTRAFLSSANEIVGRRATNEELASFVSGTGP